MGIYTALKFTQCEEDHDNYYERSHDYMTTKSIFKRPCNIEKNALSLLRKVPKRGKD